MSQGLDAQEFTRVKTSIDSILQDVGRFLGDLVEAPQGEHGQARTQIDEQLQSFFESYYALKRRHEDKSLSVAVLALTKSGKSTLLNALISHDCLPVNNVPETARICKLVHSSAALYPEPVMREGDVVHTGSEAVKQRLQTINQEVRAREHMMGDERVLQIYAPLAALEQFGPEQTSSTKLYLLDTPGPNEAGEEALRHQVERLLMGVDAVIYLLDYTKLKTAEEAEIFRRLRNINPLLVQRLAQRLFFVVNKADQVAEAEGMGADQTREYVAELVTRQLGTEGFLLKPEQVLLVSARDALLARLVLSDRAGADAMRRFQRVAFGSRARPVTREQLQAAAGTMLEESGICELEERILAFLYANSAAVKLLATIDDIVRLLQELWNVAASCQSALQQDVTTLQQQADSLRSELQTTLSDFETILKDTDGLQGKVVAEIQSSLEQLRGRLATHILTALEEAEREGTTPAAQQRRAPAGGRWARIRQNFLSTFNLARNQQDSKREELRNRLTELHNEVMVQIQEEVADFWHDLEGNANSRHRQLVAFVNRALDMVTRRIEASVGERLNLRLEPVAIRLDMPSAEQFHSDLEDLITKGISERQERHLRISQQEYQERVQRYRYSGLCRWGSYWTNVPRTRTVVETYNSKVYTLQPDEVRRHFLELVYSAVDSTQGAVASYVHEFMAAQLAEAGAKIQQYSDRYLNTMIGALELSNRGCDHRATALADIARHLERIATMRSSVSELQSEVERQVPSSCGSTGYEEVMFEDVFSETSLDQMMEDMASGAVSGGQLPQSSEADPDAPAPQDTEEAGAAADEAANFVIEGRAVPPVAVEDEHAATPQDSPAEEPSSSGAAAPVAAESSEELGGESVLVEEHEEEEGVVAAAPAAALPGDLSAVASSMLEQLAEPPELLDSASSMVEHLTVALSRSGMMLKGAEGKPAVIQEAEVAQEAALVVSGVALPAFGDVPAGSVIGSSVLQPREAAPAVTDEVPAAAAQEAVPAVVVVEDGEADGVEVPRGGAEDDSPRAEDGDLVDISAEEAEEMPGRPFDYTQGFARAMSSNGIKQPVSTNPPPSEGSVDEWTLVDK